MTDQDYSSPADVDTLNADAPASDIENQERSGEAELGSDHYQEDSPSDANVGALDNEFLLREFQDIKRQLAEMTNQSPSANSAHYAEPNYPSTPTDIVRQALSEISREQKELEYQRFQADYEHKLALAPSRFRDFQNVVFKNGKHSFSNEMIEMIKSSDDPVATIYHAAKNHSAELDRISAMPNSGAQIREMVKLEEKIKSSLRPRNISRTPAPMNDDIGSAGASTGYDLNSPDDVMSYLNKIGRG